MFIEMIKSEFKQLQGPFKLALVLIAIMTGSIFLIVHFIFNFRSREYRSNNMMACTLRYC